MPEYNIDISLQDEVWLNTIEVIKKHSENVLQNVLKRTTQGHEHIEISILLADNDFVQKLNAKYRQKNKPTNVLSFPQTEPSDLDAPSGFVSLGDIIIARETIEEEAKEQKKTIQDHYTHMLVHGCLHLLHYDHKTDEEAEEMERLEIDILNGFGIKNPYETD